MGRVGLAPGQLATPRVSSVSRLAAYNWGINGIDNPIPFDTEDSDPLGAWAAGTPTRLTAPAAGVYAVTGWFGCQTNTTFPREITLRLNGVATLFRRSCITNNAYTTPILSAQRTIKLGAGDYVELCVKGTATNPLLSVAYCSIALVG